MHNTDNRNNRDNCGAGTCIKSTISVELLMLIFGFLQSVILLTEFSGGVRRQIPSPQYQELPPQPARRRGDAGPILFPAVRFRSL
jgi:hypothetical protein